ncbi:hypothetical protein ABMA28_005033 [Loxostege sticticalis]|uniref:RNA-directed DNA polymerase n=1 Tax=Loxostege sticticalis TaxID=481309 RepID=A0ABD0ST76_LOXSC
MVQDTSLSSVESATTHQPQTMGHRMFSNRRPIIGIEVLGVLGTALLDTGAKGCIAGASLYRLLLERKHPCREDTRRIQLADGSAMTRRVLTTTLQVKIKQKRLVTLDFVIFPDSQSSDTLLGVDFMTATGIMLDFASSTWRFSESKKTYPIEFEGPRSCTYLSSADILRPDEGMMLNSEERLQLSDLLQQNEDIFKPGGGPTPFAEHHIDTGTHPPIAVPPYRLTPAKKELMRAELEKMLADDIIEECESPWAAPGILVPKKDSTYRFCVDYRGLNAVTKTDTYPIPRIDDLLQMTKRDCYMSTIDLRSGYWQVPVAPADQDKTAFTTPFGTFRFKRMPFGLKNAPSTFQRLIDRFRTNSSLNDVTLLAYLDDLMIITQGTFQDHLRDLQKVFDRLRHFGLRANRTKCHFARQNVTYLGHVITPQGICPDDSKVDAVLKMKEPNNVKHLKSFLQTCKVNVLADFLSRPVCAGTDACSVCSVTVDLPQANAEELRAGQLEDPEVRKIMEDLESSDELTSRRWLERGYIMSHGVLHRYDPEADSDEVQLVVPSSKREEVLKEFHDSPIAGHQGVERTLHRIRQRYFFVGMRRYVTEYLKKCIECQKYKPTNLKPAGLLQTPVLHQRGEVLAVDLFGPLPEGEAGERWVLLIEDTATRWVELYALQDATAEKCAKLMIEEYFLRYGFPRRIISDNGVQFISAVMQQCMYVLGIKQNLIPVYHPEANPAERKNRDMKVQLAILVKNEHRSWPSHLPQVPSETDTSRMRARAPPARFRDYVRE